MANMNLPMPFNPPENKETLKILQKILLNKKKKDVDGFVSSEEDSDENNIVTEIPKKRKKSDDSENSLEPPFKKQKLEAENEYPPQQKDKIRKENVKIQIEINTSAKPTTNSVDNTNENIVEEEILSLEGKPMNIQTYLIFNIYCRNFKGISKILSWRTFFKIVYQKYCKRCY